MHLDYFNWFQLCSTCAIFCTILHMLKNIQKWLNYEINYSGVNDTVSLFQGNWWDICRKTGNFGKKSLPTCLVNRSPTCQTCHDFALFLSLGKLMRDKFQGWNPFCTVKSDSLVLTETNETSNIPSSGQMNDQEWALLAIIRIFTGLYI